MKGTTIEMDDSRLIKVVENGRFVDSIIKAINENAKDKNIKLEDNVSIVIPNIHDVTDKYVTSLDDSCFPLYHYENNTKYYIYSKFKGYSNEEELRKVRKSFNVFSCNYTSSIFPVYYKNGGLEWLD